MTTPSPDRPTPGTVWRGNHNGLLYTVLSADADGHVVFTYGQHGSTGETTGDWFAHWTFVRYGPAKPKSVYRVVTEIR